MSHIKNPAANNNVQPETKEEKTTQLYKNENGSSKEVQLPTPEKKNDDITTGNGSKSEKNLEQAGRINPEESTEKTEKERSFKTGFDVNDTNEKQRNDKRGDETKKLERDDTNTTKTKDAKWQQEKMNEADEQGSTQSAEKEGELKDTRNDSILQRPKTETYEKGQDENIGSKIKKENYSHTSEEQKRDEQNRKQREDSKNKDNDKRKFVKQL